MWGNCPALTNGVKIQVFSYLVLFQPLSLKNGCWWLRQLLSLGVVWQDCQSLPTCTLHPQLTSQWQKKPLPSLPQGFYSLHDCARAVMHSPLRRPPELLFILSQERKWLTFTHFWLREFSPLSVCCSPTQDFPSFYPRSFPLRIYVTVAVSFPHGQIVGPVLLFLSCTSWENCNFFPSVVCVSLPGVFITWDVLLFPTFVGIVC